MHKKMKQFETVFNYGDQGDKFYYILRGDVYVLIPGYNIQEMTKDTI